MPAGLGGTFRFVGVARVEAWNSDLGKDLG